MLPQRHSSQQCLAKNKHKMLLPSKLHKLILWWGNWEKFVALSITLLWQALPELPFTGEHNWAELSEHCESRQLCGIERCPPYPDEHDCPPALPASAGQADPPCPCQSGTTLLVMVGKAIRNGLPRGPPPTSTLLYLPTQLLPLLFELH